MQSVTEWQNMQNTNTTPSAGNIQSVSDWKSNPTPVTPTGVSSVSDWLKSQPPAPTPTVTPTSTPQPGFLRTLANNIGANVIAQNNVKPPVEAPSFTLPTPSTISAPGYTPPPSLTGESINSPTPPPETTNLWDKYWGNPTKEVAKAMGQNIIDTVNTAAKSGSDFVYSLFGLTGKPDNTGKMKKVDLTDKQQVINRLTQGGTFAGNLLVGLPSTLLTAPLAGAEKTPLAPLATGVNKTFDALNQIVAPGADATTDHLPISDTSKEIVRPLMQQVFGLFAMIVTGEMTPKIVKPKLDVLNKDIQKIILDDNKARGKTNTSNIPGAEIPTPKTVQSVADWKGTNVPETPKPVQSVSDWVGAGKPVEQSNQSPIEVQTQPVSDISSKATNSLENTPVGTKPNSIEYAKTQIKSGNLEPVKVRTLEDGSMTIEDGKHRIQAAKELGIKDYPVKDVTSEYLPRSKEPTPGDLNSRVYERLQAEHPEMLPENVTYEKSPRKAGIEKAINLVKEDKQSAFDTAMGAKSGASEVESVYANITLAEKALEEGNTKLYNQLVKKRSLDQTRRGQAIEAEKASVTDNSTAKYVKELISSRLESLGKNSLSTLDKVTKRTSAKEKGIKKIDSEVTKLEKKIISKKLDMKTAVDLLDKLACI